MTELSDVLLGRVDRHGAAAPPDHACAVFRRRPRHLDPAKVKLEVVYLPLIRKRRGVRHVVAHAACTRPAAARVAGDVVVGSKLEAGGVEKVGQVPQPTRESVRVAEELAGGWISIQRAGVDVDRVKTKRLQAFGTNDVINTARVSMHRR